MSVAPTSSRPGPTRRPRPAASSPSTAPRSCPACDTVDDAVAFATAMLGERAVKVAPQFEATKAAMDVSGADRRRPARRRTGAASACSAATTRSSRRTTTATASATSPPTTSSCSATRRARSAARRSSSTRSKLVTILGEDDPELARVLLGRADRPLRAELPAGHRRRRSPASRRAAGRRCARTRTSCRCSGPTRPPSYPFVETWGDGRGRGPQRPAPASACEAGQMICIDNYRMLHGREAYVDVEPHGRVDLGLDARGRRHPRHRAEHHRTRHPHGHRPLKNRY